jgi:hypothetical protein
LGANWKVHHKQKRAAAIYTSQKKARGLWVYLPVNTGKGRNHTNLHPPYYFGHGRGEKRVWTQVKGTVQLAAKSEVEAIETGLEAQAKGITVAELGHADALRRQAIAAAAGWCERTGAATGTAARGVEVGPASGKRNVVRTKRRDRRMNATPPRIAPGPFTRVKR